MAMHKRSIQLTLAGMAQSAGKDTHNLRTWLLPEAPTDDAAAVALMRMPLLFCDRCIFLCSLVSLDVLPANSPSESFAIFRTGAAPLVCGSEAAMWVLGIAWALHTLAPVCSMGPTGMFTAFVMMKRGSSQ